MATWSLQTVSGIYAVQKAGNTLLRVRYQKPLGNTPAACHVREVLTAFFAYARQKGMERCEKQPTCAPLYTVKLTCESLAFSTAVHLTFTFAGERPPVTLTEYWCGEGAWQVARPPRRAGRPFGETPQKSKKFTKIQQLL